ncbi:MAG: hypothetical protein J6W56_08670 [Prevotella sp.]|nr:hypothetical protein [Prevotella sp.]
MRRFFLFFLIALLPAMSFGQDYEPLLKEGKTWKYTHNKPFSEDYYDFSLVVRGDTTINDLTYKKIYDVSTGAYQYALREDEKRVYCVFQTKDTPQLIYDFGKEAGEIVSEVADKDGKTIVRVVAVDAIKYGDRLLRRMEVVEEYLENDQVIGSSNGIWIEGLGSSCGLVSPVQLPGNYNTFHSCWVGNEMLGENELFVAKAQEYFPEGTKWTEIRLDTLKYDSWYSKVGDEWVPNFETIEYYVQGEYVEKEWDDDLNTFKKVYTNGPEWTDSLTLLLWEGSFNGDDKCVLATIPPIIGFDGSSYLLFPGNAYQFGWSIGTIVEFEDITSSNATAIFPPGTFDFGTIDEIKEGDFGGASSLSYADVNGVRIIQGIGVTTWNDGECLFGPVEPYQARTFFQEESEEDRHYRSMLVHFERNGEVLYDVWPEKGTISGMKSVSEVETPIANTLYDLQGRRVMGPPTKGLYIQNGKKVIVK